MSESENDSLQMLQSVC